MRSTWSSRLAVAPALHASSAPRPHLSSDAPGDAARAPRGQPRDEGPPLSTNTFNQLLYNYVTMRLCDYTTIRLYDYTTIRLCDYATIRLYYLTNQVAKNELDYYSTILPYYTTTLLYYHTTILRDYTTIIYYYHATLLHYYITIAILHYCTTIPPYYTTTLLYYHTTLQYCNTTLLCYPTPGGGERLRLRRRKCRVHVPLRDYTGADDAGLELWAW